MVLLALVFIPVLLLLGFFLEKGINKLIGVEKKKISETSAKSINRWGRGIILVISLSTLPFVMTMDINIIKWYWIAYFVILFGFQSFLEWKYLKESKQYITTLIFLIAGVIFMYNIEYLIPWS
ncbi:DUF4181 domain-containing protein [Oceanobacillus rekensis]|uniref:DUF4181 domain-containing protein n=1 Tax=Oceanobacillus rekensis TaxID=937927 RepID=UPI001FE74DD7|nr:DUF4181 domain-containing protein [Oceanobacillus rekensis]